MEVSWKALQVAGLPPSPREGHVLLALDERHVLLIGGGAISPVFGPQQFSDTYVLDFKEGSWSYITTTGDQPSPRTGLSAVVMQDQRVLVFGGSSMLEGYSNDVHILDTRSWSWSKVSTKGLPPSPRDKHTACLLGNKMYVFGGFGPSAALPSHPKDQDESDHSDPGASTASEEDDGSSDDEEHDDDASACFSWFDDLHVLDVSAMEWEKIQTTGSKPSRRAAHASFIVEVPNQDAKTLGGPKLILFGGRDSIGRQNDLFSLNLQNLEWKKETAKCPPARSFHSMVLLGDSQLAVCYGGVGVHGEMFPGLEILDVDAMQWASLNSSTGTWPPSRGASAVAVCTSSQGCEIIIFGGSCNMEGRDSIYYNDTYSIDGSLLVRHL